MGSERTTDSPDFTLFSGHLLTNTAKSQSWRETRDKGTTWAKAWESAKTSISSRDLHFQSWKTHTPIFCSGFTDCLHGKAKLHLSSDTTVTSQVSFCTKCPGHQKVSKVNHSKENWKFIYLTCTEEARSLKNRGCNTTAFTLTLWEWQTKQMKKMEQAVICLLLTFSADTLHSKEVIQISSECMLGKDSQKSIKALRHNRLETIQKRCLKQIDWLYSRSKSPFQVWTTLSFQLLSATISLIHGCICQQKGTVNRGRRAKFFSYDDNEQKWPQFGPVTFHYQPQSLF